MLLTKLEDYILALACLVKARNQAGHLQEYSDINERIEGIQQQICMHMAQRMDLDKVDLLALLKEIE